ncbi:hypothetical protein ACFWBH_01130 [Streptomyces sp. NPDC059999]|uniref:hypothetical protein n=1 Tax=Streptomyces sp. NPDC059999 TaxID=3347030 RepID=UPI00367BAB9D
MGDPVQELRFEDNIRFTLEVGEQASLQRSIGGHDLHLQTAIGVSPFTEAGKLLALEATLFGFGASPINRARLGRTTANLPYTQVVTVHRQPLVFPLTSLQLHAIEAGRTGDVRFEIEVDATLPQAAGYPGTAKVTDYVTIPKSRWEEQLAQVSPSAAFEMAVPYPLHDSRRAEPGRVLREAQRLITTNHVRGAILEVRRALEWIQQNAGWDKPGPRKDPRQCTQTERWWRIQDALYSQTSGAMHNDAVTKDFDYSRAEAETLLSMTAALLRNVPELLPEPAGDSDSEGA